MCPRVDPTAAAATTNPLCCPFLKNFRRDVDAECSRAETASRPLVAPHAHALNSTYAWRITWGRGQTKPLKAIYADTPAQVSYMNWNQEEMLTCLLFNWLFEISCFVFTWHNWKVSKSPLSKPNYHYLSEEILFYLRGGGWLNFKNKGCNVTAGEYSWSFVLTGRMEREGKT